MSRLKSNPPSRFRPGWLPSVAVALLLPLFVSLGFWQLRRAEEKNALMAERERQPQQAVLQMTETWATPANRYRRVQLAGEWDMAHQFLLDNQLFKQQPGYQVLTPLRLADGSAVLVNRGWVPVGADRRRLPDVSLHSRHAEFIGMIDQFPGVGFRLQGAEIPAAGWPSRVQLLDAERLGERLGYRLPPYQVLLPAADAEAYARDWQFASLSPEKNQGYALQWFSFALVLAGLYVWHGVKGRAE